jgi:hypothetical protein
MKFIVMILLNLGILGCAEPKYEVRQSSGTAGGSQGSEEANNGKVECAQLFAQNNICLHWIYENETPLAQKYISLIVKLYRLNQYDQTLVYTDPDLNTQLKVTLWMSSMGHGSVPTQTTKLDTGTYRISNVNFIMSGPWDIYFDLIQNNQIDRLTEHVLIQ